MGVPMNEEVVALPHHRPVRRCCCGCSLQIGCAIIGTLGVLNGISSLFNGLGPLVIYGQGAGFSLSSIGTILYGALNLVAGLCLIYGADKRKVSLLTFWLYTHYFQLVMCVVFALYRLVMLVQMAIPVSTALLMSFAFVVGIGIFSYCIAVVHKFRKEVSDDIQDLKENIESASSNIKSNW